MTAVADRVAAGAAFLDEHDPQWWRPDVDRAIDLGDLDLASTRLCILGQRCPVDAVFNAPGWVYGHYEAMALQFGPFCDRDDINAWAAPLGFQAFTAGTDEDEDDIEYKELTAEWTRVITERRAAA